MAIAQAALFILLQVQGGKFHRDYSTQAKDGIIANKRPPVLNAALLISVGN
jgi:hypothetical protein